MDGLDIILPQLCYVEGKVKCQVYMLLRVYSPIASPHDITLLYPIAISGNGRLSSASQGIGASNMRTTVTVQS